MDRVRVSILGATGLVGQWMVKLLTNHPFIESSVYQHRLARLVVSMARPSTGSYLVTYLSMPGT